MLRDQFMMKEDKYPNDFNQAYQLLYLYITAKNIPEVNGGSKKGKASNEDQDKVMKGAQYLQDFKKILKPGVNRKPTMSSVSHVTREAITRGNTRTKRK